MLSLKERQKFADDLQNGRGEAGAGDSHSPRLGTNTQVADACSSYTCQTSAPHTPLPPRRTAKLAGASGPATPRHFSEVAFAHADYCFNQNAMRLFDECMSNRGAPGTAEHDYNTRAAWKYAQMIMDIPPREWTDEIPAGFGPDYFQPIYLEAAE